MGSGEEGPLRGADEHHSFEAFQSHGEVSERAHGQSNSPPHQSTANHANDREAMFEPKQNHKI